MRWMWNLNLGFPKFVLDSWGSWQGKTADLLEKRSKEDEEG